MRIPAAPSAKGDASSRASRAAACRLSRSAIADQNAITVGQRLGRLSLASGAEQHLGGLPFGGRNSMLPRDCEPVRGEVARMERHVVSRPA